MPDHVYKHIDLTGTSATSIEDAVNTAVARAARPSTTCAGSRSSRPAGNVKDGEVDQWQTTIRVAFTLDD